MIWSLEFGYCILLFVISPLRGAMGMQGFDSKFPY